MRYSSIVVYVREGDKVTPVRYSRFDYAGRGEMPFGYHVKVLDWAELYGNHTSWVAERVAESVARNNYRKAA